MEQSEDLSVAIEALEVEGEEDGGKQRVLPQPQPQITPLAPLLSLACVSKHEKKQAESDHEMALTLYAGPARKEGFNACFYY